MPTLPISPKVPLTVAQHIPPPNSQMKRVIDGDAPAMKKGTQIRMSDLFPSPTEPLPRWRTQGLERCPSQHLVWSLSSVVSAVTSEGRKKHKRCIVRINTHFCHQIMPHQLNKDEGEIWCSFLLRPQKSVNGEHHLLSIKRTSFL